ncbi:hypothetical protein MW887_009483 [Aspergillus wentii]|nr:hypothetical protein MW887_009483 [Aspergillus wentii]
MSTTANAIIDGIKGRRSIYALTNESTIPDSRLEEILTEVITHTPSSFNTQTSRVVVLLKDEHQKLWDVAREVASSTVPAELFQKLYKPRIELFRAGYGTILFYEDHAPFEPLAEKWPMLKDKFPEWSNHSSGMHQFASEGLGCNLQHYSPMLDEPVSKHWNVPKEWNLKAQLVFGKPVGPPKEKTFEPLSQRLFVHGK